jgi:hypothetical protein
MTRGWRESLPLHHLELSSMNTSLVLTGASQDKRVIAGRSYPAVIIPLFMISPDPSTITQRPYR